MEAGGTEASGGGGFRSWGGHISSVLPTSIALSLRTRDYFILIRLIPPTEVSCSSPTPQRHSKPHSGSSRQEQYPFSVKDRMRVPLCLIRREKCERWDRKEALKAAVRRAQAGDLGLGVFDRLAGGASFVVALRLPVPLCWCDDFVEEGGPGAMQTLSVKCFLAVNTGTASFWYFCTLGIHIQLQVVHAGKHMLRCIELSALSRANKQSKTQISPSIGQLYRWIRSHYTEYVYKG